jgi:histidine kinase
LGQQLKLRGIKVVLDLEDDLPLMMGNTNRLEQVFINLVVNSRNAIEAKKGEFAKGEVESTLTVRSFQENGRVVVTFTDTGTGIPDDLKDKIFEPFFTTKEVGKGTGLGLYISYGIVKDYDGTIEVESELGRGATFKLTFPAWGEDENGPQ